MGKLVGSFSSISHCFTEKVSFHLKRQNSDEEYLYLVRGRYLHAIWTNVFFYLNYMLNNKYLILNSIFKHKIMYNQFLRSF